jgi:hypothetical protein
MTAASQASLLAAPKRDPGDVGMNATFTPIADRETSAGAPPLRIGLTVENRLRASGYFALRGVSCSASDGAACLYGSLPSYYLKQLAQEIAGAVGGVHMVINKIQVCAAARPRRAETH